jgi:hypothetical protein
VSNPKAIKGVPKNLGKLVDKARAEDAPAAFTSIRPPPTGASPAGWHHISAMFECPKKFHLRQVWGIRKPQYMTPDPLAVGSLFHAGRAHWFLSHFPTGADYWTKLQAYVQDAALRQDLPVREDAVRRCLGYLHQYMEYWSSRAKPRVGGVEYALSAGIPGIVDPRTARLDDWGEYPESNFKLALGELKTTSTSIKDCVQEYTVHGQTTLQQLLWAMSPEGDAKHGPVDHTILDIVVKGYDKEKCTFGRVALRIPEFQKRWFVRELGVAVSMAERLTKDSTEVPRIITSCTRIMGRMRVDCEYKELCQRGAPASTGYVDAEGKGLSTYVNKPGVKPWD